MKVLIAEDNADDRKLLRINLEHRGIEVFEAADGREGLELARKYRPDLIIADALMPVMDGYQFLRSVKQDPATESIPFIFYSAVYTGHREAELAISLGAEAFVIKPKEPGEFWDEIKDLLDIPKGKKEKTLSARLIEEDEEFLSKYSHIVATKLEEKVRALEREVAVRKDAEERLRQSEESFKALSQEYHTLLDSMPDAVFLISPELKIRWANKSAAFRTGMSHEELVGKNCYEILQNRRHPCSPCAVRRSILTGKSELEITGMADGQTLETRASPIGDVNGVISGVLLLVRDVSEQRKLEEQLRQAQKMEAVGQLAGGIAHDFNNILSGIIGYGHLCLMSMTQDDPLRLHIEQMLHAADRATHLTQSLLAFSRKQTLDRKPVDLNEIVKKVQKFLGRIIGEDIVIKTVFAEDSLSILGDEGQLDQMLINLATNSRDAMPRGGTFIIETKRIEIDEAFVRTHGYGDPGHYALLSVTDTGAGMPEETKSRIFEPFFTTKEVGKGTGLGLSIVYGIVKQHGGYITVYSESGMGTTFRIYFPMSGEKTFEEKKAAEYAYPAGGTETVLVAEDDASLRKLAKSVLEDFGYTVIEAVDGEDAVTRFMENRDRIDLLLFDIVMPKKSGRDAYDEINVIKPGIKAIFLSGYAPDVIRQKGFSEKELTLISKPISPLELLKEVRNVLDEGKK